MSATFALGTAQLGFDYGAANHGGQPAYEIAREIVATAWHGGVRFFDTARSYGESEQILGNVFVELSLCEEALVQTKWDLDEVADASDVEALFCKSLERLQVESLHTLYAHHYESFAAASPAVKAALKELVDSGRLKHFGVSVYDPDEATAVMNNDLVSVIQIPGNVFDRRFEEAGFIDAAKQKGVQVFVRSLYLQGLLVLDPMNLPERFRFAEPVIFGWRKFCAEHQVEPAAFALHYVPAKGWGIPVIGCESPEQVRENIELLNTVSEMQDELIAAWDSSSASLQGSKINDPRKWAA